MRVVHREKAVANVGSFEHPCEPWGNVHKGQADFTSRHQQVSSPSQMMTWPLMINNTDELFFYCSAPNSCKGYGIVGVINPVRFISKHWTVLIW
jgi:hypothetical protein